MGGGAIGAGGQGEIIGGVGASKLTFQKHACGADTRGVPGDGFLQSEKPDADEARRPKPQNGGSDATPGRQIPKSPSFGTGSTYFNAWLERLGNLRVDHIAKADIIAVRAHHRIRRPVEKQKSAIWRRIAADLFGYLVVTMQSPEGAALVAAIQALAITVRSRMLSQWTESSAAVDESTRTEPDKNSLNCTAPCEKPSSVLEARHPRP